MSKIKRCYKEIKQVLPKKYHFKIQVMPDTKQICRVIAKRNNTSYSTIITSYNRLISSDKYDKSRHLVDNLGWRPERVSIRDRVEIHGLASNPILLNKRLNSYSEQCIFFTILHEIGHLSNFGTKDFHNEEVADKFALEWMEKMGVLK